MSNQRGQYNAKTGQLGGGWIALVCIGGLGVGAVFLVRHQARDYETRMRGFK